MQLAPHNTARPIRPYSPTSCPQNTGVVVAFPIDPKEEEAAEAARVGGAWLCDLAAREGL